MTEQTPVPLPGRVALVALIALGSLAASIAWPRDADGGETATPRTVS